jgi:hypothetical protein
MSPCPIATEMRCPDHVRFSNRRLVALLSRAHLRKILNATISNATKWNTIPQFAIAGKVGAHTALRAVDRGFDV